MWVRSQNRIVLKRLQDIEYYKDRKKHFVIGGSLLGEYKTEERCLEIIDEIQKLLLSANGDYLIKLQDIDVNAEVKTVYGEDFIQKLQNSRIMPIANEPSVQFVQPSVLVYEMPKE